MSDRPPEPGALVLRVVSGPDVGSMVPLHGPVAIGREADLVLSDPTVSRRHALLTPGGTQVEVRDLGSRGGTRVDGSLDRSLADPGALIELGTTALRVLRVELRPDEDDGVLEICEAGATRTVALRNGLTLGRDRSSDVRVVHDSVSRRHASVETDRDDDWVLVDHSTNGTWINDERVQGERALRPGDRVRLGESSARLTRPARSAGSGRRVRLRLGAEGDEHSWAVEVSTEAGVRCADVVSELARYVGHSEMASFGYRTVDGAVLPGDALWESVGMRDGDRLVIAGGTPPHASGAAPIGVRSPIVRVNQLPRAVHPPKPHSVRPPAFPESLSLRGRGLLWQVVGGAGMLFGGAAIAVLRPAYAIFGAIMVTAGVISLGASILGDQSRRRHRHRDWENQIGDLDDQLHRVVRDQIEALRHVSPDDRALESIIEDHTARLFERRSTDDDALRLRIGTGDLAARIAVDAPSFGFGRTGESELDAVMSNHRRLGDVPVCASNTASSLVGIVGPRRATTDLVNRMLLEAAALHPPDQLRIWVLANDETWSWARWLPHVSSGDSRLGWSPATLVEAADEAVRELGGDSPGRAHGSAGAPVLDLVVVGADAQRLPAVAGLLDRRRPALTIAVGETPRDLPSGVSTLVAIDPNDTVQVTGDDPDPALGPVIVAGIDPATAASLAARLTCVRVAHDQGNSESGGDLCALLAGCRVDELDVGELWARPRPRLLETPIGLTDSGDALTLGFREHGPHGFLAGTTGSGKSELLSTLLAGLVLRHPPEQLNLFLIDFKGGATFAPFAALPHVVGMVTDLEHDDALAERAFTSLEAELDRRKQLLDLAGVKDLGDYEALGATAPEPLANLVVVIDEFALLVKRQPDVRERLDTVTAQGRSLGVHLLLATQTPSGVISNSIRANTNLWICLRVANDSESSEVLGKRDAARIAGDRPGRGYVRFGASDTISGFQAARVGRPVELTVGATVAVRAFADAVPPGSSSARSGSPEGSDSVGPAETTGAGPIRTELDVVVETIVAHHFQRGAGAIRRLWTDPLPAELDPQRLDTQVVTTDRPIAVLGLVDQPERQRQIPAVIDFATVGNQLIVGGRGSGRTTALRRVAEDLGRRHAPEDLHLYGIDAGGGALAAIEDLPHVGAIVAASDAERVERLIGRLRRVVDERQRALIEDGFADFVSMRAAQERPDQWVIVLIDDFGSYRELVDPENSGEGVESLTNLLRSGPTVGIHLVVTMSQTTDMRMSQQNLFGQRLVLRAADPIDYQLIDLRLRAEQFSQWPAGRGVVAGGHAVQIAAPEPDATRSIEAKWAAVAPELLPRPVRRLPTQIDLAQIGLAGIDPVESDETDDRLLIGVGGPEGEPIALDLGPANGVFFVIGPGRSGRSTALVTACESARRSREVGAVHVLAPRQSPLRSVVSTTARISIDQDEIDAALVAVRSEAEQGRHPVLVIDDAEALPASAGEPVAHLIRHAAELGVFVAIAVRTSDLPGAMGPWSRYLQSLRCGLALQPGSDEAYVLGVRPQRDGPTWPPGRGLWVAGGEAQRLQVAQVEVRAS